MGKRLYVLSSGRLRRQQNTLVLETEEGKKFFPVEQVEEIYSKERRVLSLFLRKIP
jgi:CRISPR-associated protein Cas1